MVGIAAESENGQETRFVRTTEGKDGDESFRIDLMSIQKGDIEFYLSIFMFLTDVVLPSTTYSNMSPVLGRDGCKEDEKV